jgi:uncharacterized protein (TIGR03435 family)
VTLRRLISVAYGLAMPRIVGGPEWTGTTRYDIVAKAADDASPEQLRLMQQTLLRERFNLSLRREKRDVPAYSLVLARSDRRLGPRLRPAAIDCSNPATRQTAPEFAAGTQRPSCGVRTTPTSFRGGGVGLTRVIDVLAQTVGRPVADGTRLAGMFDFDLEWAGPLEPVGGPADGASIFTALQEQLGLRLQPSRAAVDFLVIEGADRPADN